MSIQLSVVIPVVALIVVILLIVRDPEVSFTERDQRILFPSVVAVGIVSTALGVLLVVGIYLSLDLPSVLPDHNLISSWQINFDELGYSRAEALEQVNLGYMWHAMALMGYMMFVLGGSLFVAVYRIGGGGDPLAADSAATVSAGARGGRLSRDSRLESVLSPALPCQEKRMRAGV